MSARARRAFDDGARWIGRHPLGCKVVNAAHRFALMGSGFSYEMAVNGEACLVRQVVKSIQGNEPFATFDVGAHRGLWTDLVQELAGPECRCYLFEPTPELFESLSVRLASSQNTFVNRLALADIDGSVDFLRYADGESTVNSLIVSHDFHATESDPGTVIDVPVSTGDFYCQENGVDRIDLMKVDVEGGEMLVLRGFSNMISKQKISIVQFEYGYANGDAGHLMKDFYRFWESNGYRVGVLRRDGVAFQPFSYPLNNFDSGPNFVAALPEFIELLQHFD
jgi:FkbM family methyltransferase